MATPFETSISALRPEARLLICCARMQIDDTIAAQIHLLLQENINWDDLLQMAFAHDVGVLLYRTLESVAPTALPAYIRTELKRQMQVDIQRNLSLTRELLRLTTLFDRHSIAMIPYKGPMIAAGVYGDLSARAFTDLDILIHEEDIPRAVDTLISCGYEIVRPRSLTQAREQFRPLWIRQLVKRSPWTYQIVLWHPELATLVELHWRVMSKYIFPRNPKQLWENLQSISVGGANIQSMAPEHLLWFLCLHSSKHQWERLRWVCDIAELIRVSPELNWPQVVEQAASLKIERRLYVGLQLARQLLDAPVPAVIQAKIDQMSNVKALALQVIESLFEQNDSQEKFLDIPQLRFQLRSMDRLADRFWYFLRFLNDIEAMITAERKLVRRFSLLSLSSSLLRRLNPYSETDL